MWLKNAGFSGCLRKRSDVFGTLEMQYGGRCTCGVCFVREGIDHLSEQRSRISTKAIRCPLVNY